MPILVYDFSGGINDRDADSILNDNESPDMENVVLGRRGTIQTRPGTVLFRNAFVSSASPVTSLYEHVDAVGNSYVLAFAGTSLSRATANNWVVLRTGFTANTYLFFVSNSIINKSLFVNGIDGYFETDGMTCNPVVMYTPTTQEQTNIGQCVFPANPRLIAYHKYRVWLGNINPSFPDRVYYSVDDINGNTLYNYFTPTGWLRASNPKGEGLTAMVSFRGRLYLFTATTIKAISGDDLVNFRMDDYSTDVGTVSARTVKIIGDYMIFLGHDGVYMCDGNNAPFNISQRIQNIIRNVSLNHRHLSAAIVSNGQYYLSIPESTVNDITLMYDANVIPLTYMGDRHSFANSPWVKHRGFVPNDWIVARDLQMYFGANDGYVYQYGISKADNGREIKAYYVTKRFDLRAPDRMKRFRNLQLDVNRSPDSFMRIEYMTDLDDEWKVLREEIGLNNPRLHAQMNFPDGKGPLCRKLALRLSSMFSGSEFTINGLSMDVALRGQQMKMEGER